MKRKNLINNKIKGYSIIKKLGEGRYGIVYLGRNMLGEKVVIKQLKKPMARMLGEKIIYEAKILQNINDDRFPKFIGKFRNKYGQGYILQYIKGKTFENILFEDQYEFSKEEIYTITDKLLEIVSILDKNNIVHKDIRIPNVIQKPDKELVLIDFGLARFIDNVKYTKDMDFWFIGDFLIHLYYSSYKENDNEEKPWYEELELLPKEKLFLKKLMEIEEKYNSIEEIKKDFIEVKEEYFSLLKQMIK